MTHTGLFYGDFDPITTFDISNALSTLKTLKLNQIALVVSEGKDYFHRIKMVKIAIKPYRKLKIFTQKEKRVLYIDLDLKDTGLINDTFICLSNSVARYCVLNELYLSDILKNKLSSKRFLHSISVGILTKELANHYNIDRSIGYAAGLLHDYTKELNKEEQLKLMKIYFPNDIDKNKKIFHQYTAMIKVRQDFRIYDRVILDAIKNHVNGTDKKPLSKIVFCADKIDDTRGLENQKIKALCFADIDKAFNMIKNTQDEFLNGGKE